MTSLAWMSFSWVSLYIHTGVSANSRWNVVCATMEAAQWPECFPCCHNMCACCFRDADDIGMTAMFN